MTALEIDLDRIRARLLERRATLTERHAGVSRDLARSNDPLVADFGDQAIQTANDEVLEEIDEAAQVEVRAIDAALHRLDRGQYGICEQCEGQIESARLQAVPQATTCARCADA